MTEHGLQGGEQGKVGDQSVCPEESPGTLTQTQLLWGHPDPLSASVWCFPGPPGWECSVPLSILSPGWSIWILGSTCTCPSRGRDCPEDLVWRMEYFFVTCFKLLASCTGLVKKHDYVYWKFWWKGIGNALWLFSVDSAPHFIGVSGGESELRRGKPPVAPPPP